MAAIGAVMTDSPDRDAVALDAMGERSITVNGQKRKIRMHLLAQERITETLEIESLLDLPNLLRKIDANVVAVITWACLIDEPEMDLDEVKVAHIPRMQAVTALMECVNLAVSGSGDGTNPFAEEEDDTEDDDDEGKVERPGT